MDQTASANKSLLWHFRKRSKNANLDRYIHLRACRHCQEASESEQESLHNSTDFERITFRENPYRTGSFAFRLQKTGGGKP